MGLLESLSSLANHTGKLDGLRTTETRLWTQATLATNERVACAQASRGKLASAIEYGLPLDKALMVCEKFSLLDSEDLMFFQRQLSKSLMDGAGFARYLRKATIHKTPMIKADNGLLEEMV